MPGWGGRDGHTGIFPFIPGSGTHEYPILMWQFSDGLVITAAQAPYEDLVGSRIDGDRRPPDRRRSWPSSSRSRPATTRRTCWPYAPLYLRTSELLAGLGRASTPPDRPRSPSPARDRRPTRDVRIEPILADDDVAWHGGDPLTLPLDDAALVAATSTKPLWWTYLADSRTLYVQYNEVRGGIDAIADEILARAKQADVDRVVVDLRNNGGGDNNTYRHLLAVLQDPAIDRPGRLVLLIGRLTFSAAANFATELEQTTGATFVGEDMGGSPNLYGDVRPTRLPYGAPADRRLRRDALLGEEHRRRPADHDRARHRRSSPRRLSLGATRSSRRSAGNARSLRAAGYPAPVTGTPDLLITGGTVVRADGSQRADIAIRGGRIEAVEPDLGGLARERAARRSTRPGCWSSPGAVDVHTHTRVATDAEPDRFFQDSVAAAFGGTTTFLSFNNPGTGSSPAAERSLLTGRPRVAGRDRRRQRHRLRPEPRGQRPCDDPLAELPATIEAGVATSKAFMVFDFRLPDARLFEAMRVMGRRGGMLQVHCEDPVLLDAAVADALAAW